MISLGQADEGDYYKLDYRQARRESWGGSGSMTACFFVKIMLRDLNLLSLLLSRDLFIQLHQCPAI